MLAICKYLLPSLYQWTPVYMAAEGGNIEIVRCLIDKGADINVKDNNGVSILLRVKESTRYIVPTKFSIVIREFCVVSFLFIFFT